jgi:hypothetical protein
MKLNNDEYFYKYIKYKNKYTNLKNIALSGVSTVINTSENLLFDFVKSLYRRTKCTLYRFHNSQLLKIKNILTKIKDDPNFLSLQVYDDNNNKNPGISLNNFKNTILRIIDTNNLSDSFKDELYYVINNVDCICKHTKITVSSTLKTECIPD